MYFLDKKDTENSGDGVTIDQNIYILNEIDIKKSIRKLEILIQEKSPATPDKIKKTKPKKYPESSDYDSIGLECDHPSRRNKSKIEFNGYLNASINSKEISNKLQEKLGIQIENKSNCINCLNIFK